MAGARHDTTRETKREETNAICGVEQGRHSVRMILSLSMLACTAALDPGWGSKCDIGVGQGETNNTSGTRPCAVEQRIISRHSSISEEETRCHMMACVR